MNKNNNNLGHPKNNAQGHDQHVRPQQGGQRQDQQSRPQQGTPKNNHQKNASTED